MSHKTQAYYFNMSGAYIRIINHLLNYIPITKNSLEHLQDQVLQVFKYTKVFKYTIDNFTNKDEIIINDQEIIKIIIRNTADLMFSITQEYPPNANNNRCLIYILEHNKQTMQDLGVDHIINKKIINYYNMLSNIGAQIHLNFNTSNPLWDGDGNYLFQIFFHPNMLVINDYLKSIDQLIPKTIKLLLNIPREDIDNIFTYRFDIINLMPTLNNLGPDLYKDECPICNYDTCISKKCRYFVNNYPEKNKISSLYHVGREYQDKIYSVNKFLVEFFSNYDNIVNSQENKNDMKKKNDIKQLQKDYCLSQIGECKTNKLNPDMLKIIFNFINFTHFDYEKFARFEHNKEWCDKLGPFPKQQEIDAQEVLFLNY